MLGGSYSKDIHVYVCYQLLGLIDIKCTVKGDKNKVT
jgi:hypothetical protein